MALSRDELATLSLLQAKLNLDKPHLYRSNAYYDGLQRLETLGLAVPPALERFVTVVDWPSIAVNRLEERLDLEGFLLPGENEADSELWRVWQANDLDEESQLAHLDALVFRWSFVCGGTNEDDPSTPLVTVESPLEMTAIRDPRTRLLSSAGKFYKDATNTFLLATLYLPNETVWCQLTGQGWIEDPDLPRDTHGLGRVPVVPIVNRPRTAHRAGVSQINHSMRTLTDAACRALTNAQLATEVLAVPQRYVLGAAPSDFQDQDGNSVTAWETYFSSVWALMNSDAKVGQFTAADLGNFSRIVEHYAKMMASSTGYPMRFFGLGGDNPPSAEGIRADESTLIKSAERRQRTWGGSWEHVMRLVKRLQDGRWDPDLALMETQWRNAATPTRAQEADAAVKLHAAGILPTEAAWEDLGYSATRRRKLREQFADQQSDPVLERIARDLTAAPAVAGDAASNG